MSSPPPSSNLFLSPYYLSAMKKSTANTARHPPGIQEVPESRVLHPLDDTSPLTMFTLFSRLPTELRLEIWRLSCVPRVVEVQYCPSRDRCLTSTRPPTILSVCAESRAEALRAYYTRAFATETYPEGTIYFSPALDVLYLPRDSTGGGGQDRHHKRISNGTNDMDVNLDTTNTVGYGDTHRDFTQYVHGTAPLVRRLAIDHVLPTVRRPWETYNKFCLMANFTQLRETFLVFARKPEYGDSPNSCEDGGDETEEERGGQIEFVDPTDDMGIISGWLERVRESFRYEVGPPASFLAARRAIAATGTPTAASAAEQGVNPTVPFPLIPKRKATCSSSGLQRAPICAACT